MSLIPMQKNVIELQSDVMKTKQLRNDARTVVAEWDFNGFQMGFEWLGN